MNTCEVCDGREFILVRGKQIDCPACCVQPKPEPAIVWRFYEAPEELKALSTNGGDEDWLVELPPGWCEYGLPGWIERMDAGFEPDAYPHPNKTGWKVIIGAHA